MASVVALLCPLPSIILLQTIPCICTLIITVSYGPITPCQGSIHSYFQLVSHLGIDQIYLASLWYGLRATISDVKPGYGGYFVGLLACLLAA